MNKNFSRIKPIVDEKTLKAEQLREIDNAIEKLGISKEQADAIRLIANRVGDQIGQLVASLIEDALLLVLSGKHPASPLPSSEPQKTTPPPYTLLNAAEVAKIVGISKSQVYLMMQRNEIPSIQIGKSVRVKPEDLKDYLENKRKG